MWRALLVFAAKHLPMVCGTLSMPCQQTSDPCRLDPVAHKHTRGNTRLCQPMHASGRAHQSVCHACVVRAESCMNTSTTGSHCYVISILRPNLLSCRADVTGFGLVVKRQQPETPAVRNLSALWLLVFDENQRTYDVFACVRYQPHIREHFDALLHDTMPNGGVGSPSEGSDYFKLAAVRSVLLSIMVASSQ